MELRAETIARVRAHWRAWEVENDWPNAVSIVTIAADRFIRCPEWLRARVDDGAPLDLDELVAVLGDDVERVVGEARLAYSDDQSLRLVAVSDVTDIADDDPRLAALEAASDPKEWLEASMDEPCDHRPGIVRDGSLLAVGSLQVWNNELGHIGVFTGRDARRQGLARRVGSAAVINATKRGLVPQWRSRIGNEPSARVADKLGFVAFGRQMTVRVWVPN